MLKKLYDRLFADARVRLLYRAILAGAVVEFYADEPFSKAAIVAAGWAAIESFTPLNSLVGLFKKPAA